MVNPRISRRALLKVSATAAIEFPYIVPRHVLGGPGYTPPSEVFTRAYIGVGGRGRDLIRRNEPGEPPATLAVCDVYGKRMAPAMEKAGPGCKAYADYREVLDRTDVDVVYIATPPHWHALISIHAAQAGKDVYCEKPMTRFIHEGRAVVEAIQRYGRVFHIGTFGRYEKVNLRKLVLSGLLGTPLTVRMGPPDYNWKVREWSGRTDLAPQTPPRDLDWDFWLGPAPDKPYHPHRCHGSFRGYWDYDGGGFADMGAHYLDPIQYAIGADETGPVEIEATAPWPVDSDAIGMWGSITYRFKNGTTLHCSSGEWGPAVARGLPLIEGPKGRVYHDGRTDPPGLLEEMSRHPDPPVMIDFETALRTRKQPGGNAEASHRVASLLHLGNLAIRLGRRLHWDPAAEQFIGDEQANRLVNIPMRAPWHL
jgi:predicted dehydrogenase